MDKDYVVVCIFVICVKFLFVPMYHSTDMEVHRNWMAITHTHNTSQWYFENTSEWSLDYPPLFAWFEYSLSFLAKYFDAAMLDVKNLNYESPETVFFMRLSVVISDVVYIIAVKRLYDLLKCTHWHSDDDPWIKPEVIFAMLMLWNPGLLMVDNIHFQYNGFLNGFLFLSISAMMHENYLQSALWYSVLLNLKHIYIYFAPAYFVYLLKHYCFKIHRLEKRISWQNFSFANFCKLSAVVLGVFSVSFGPFASPHQIKQVLRQLFPVKRGLTHAYWAPNVWALYNTFDRALVVLKHYAMGSKTYGAASVTKGLVEEYKHVVLPSVNLEVTVIFTLLAIMPFLYIIWKSPKDSTLFIRSLVGCAFSSFIFGYHVHEKAIMMITMPLTILAVVDPSVMHFFNLLSAVGYFALFPLLYESGETPVKIIVLLLYLVYSYTSLKRLHKYRIQKSGFSLIEKAILAAIPAVQIFYSFGLEITGLGQKFPFLPLMIMSLFCGSGVLYCFVKFLFASIQPKSRPSQGKKKFH